MDEKNFDNKIKDILENSPQMELNPAAMADMRQRLDAAKGSSRRGGAWLWWLPLLLLPFLLGGYLFYSQNLKLQQQIDQLQTQLSSQSQFSNSQSFHREDTLAKHITYQFDTIYRTFYKDIIIERTIQSSNSFTPNRENHQYSNLYPFNKLRYGPNSYQPISIQSIRRSLGVPGPYAISTHPNSSFPFSNTQPGLQQVPLFGSENTNTTNSPDRYKNIASFNQLPALQWPLLSSNRALWQQMDPEKLYDVEPMEMERNVPPLYQLVPTGLELSLHGSPFTFSNAPAADGAALYGFSAEIIFASQLRLQLGADFLQVKTYAENAADIAGYPTLPPNSPGDILEEVKGSFNYLQLPVGFKYLFGKTQKWRPFLGAAMVAQRPFRQKFIYEYINTTTGEYKLNNSLSDGSFSINNLRSTIGINYLIQNKLSAELGLLYHRSFEQGNGEYFKLQYWALDVGVKYGF